MPKYVRLESEALRIAMQELPGWELRQGRLHREFEFPDFQAAMAFMVQAAMEAHRLDHHPEWSNVYNRVMVNLSTHFTGGITTLDIELAQAMNRLAAV